MVIYRIEKKIEQFWDMHEYGFERCYCYYFFFYFPQSSLVFSGFFDGNLRRNDRLSTFNSLPWKIPEQKTDVDKFFHSVH